MSTPVDEISLAKVKNLDRREQLNWERELLGLYVSDHPLSPYLNTLKQKTSHTSSDLSEAANRQKVVVAGMVSRFRPHLTKDGKNMGFVTLEDMQGNIELVIFPRTWELYWSMVQVDKVLSASGRVDATGAEPKVLVDSLQEITLNEIDIAPPSQQKDIQDAPVDSQSQFYGEVQDDTLEMVASDSSLIFDENEYGDAGDWGFETIPPPPLFVETTNRQIAESGGSETISQEPLKSAPTNNQAKPKPEVTAIHSADISPSKSTIAVSTKSWDHLEDAIKYGTDIEPVIPPPMPTNIGLVIPKENYFDKNAESKTPRLAVITLRSTGNKEKDVFRLRRIYGKLVSSPGQDHFVFQVYENNRIYMLEFPNETTGLTSELVSTLIDLTGEGNLRIDPYRVQ